MGGYWCSANVTGEAGRCRAVCSTVTRTRPLRCAARCAEEIGLHIDPGEPVTVVIDADERRVDVIFVVPITVRPEVHPQGEAIAARWLTRADLGTVDTSTAQAFGALVRSRAGGAGPGRVLGEDWAEGWQDT